jgi:hypothetical protein
MLVQIEGAPPGVIALEAVGEVTADDYDAMLLPAVEEATAGGGEIRIVVELGPRFTGYSLGAMWEDSEVGLGNLGKWRRAAVVTDRDWIRQGVHAFSFLMPGEVMVFPTEQRVDALAWAGA